MVGISNLCDRKRSEVCCHLLQLTRLEVRVPSWSRRLVSPILAPTCKFGIVFVVVLPARRNGLVSREASFLCAYLNESSRKPLRGRTATQMPPPETIGLSSWQAFRPLCECRRTSSKSDTPGRCSQTSFRFEFVPAVFSKLMSKEMILNTSGLRRLSLMRFSEKEGKGSSRMIIVTNYKRSVKKDCQNCTAVKLRMEGTRLLAGDYLP